MLESASISRLVLSIEFTNILQYLCKFRRTIGEVFCGLFRIEFRFVEFVVLLDSCPVGGSTDTSRVDDGLFGGLHEFLQFRETVGAGELFEWLDDVGFEFVGEDFGGDVIETTVL